MAPLNAINWFEIPVRDLDRAANFYNTMLGKPVQRFDFHGAPHGMFTYEDGGVSGALVVAPHLIPSSENGSVIYLNAMGDIDGAIERARAAGAKVVLEKTAIPPEGWIARLIDTEGNTIGLHQPQEGV